MHCVLPFLMSPRWTASETDGSALIAAIRFGKVGSPAFCAGLSQTACLDAWPKCAPLYDDVCCPSCAPGACADCINMQFYGCYEVSQVCGGTTPCGVASKENCAGQPAACADDYCPANAGCVVACKPDAGGQCDVSECHAVTVGTCTSFCDGIPPNCPLELTADVAIGLDAAPAK